MIKLPADQGLLQLGALGLALVLTALLGLERELRNKSAGLRTNTLVGVGAALFMLVSKYGFSDVIEPWRVTLDPSRVASQVASGIGFIGGGLIFIRRDAVCGLTTAAVVWVSAAVGLACGAGLPVLATAVTAGHFMVVYGFTALNRRLPTPRHVLSQVRVTYLDSSRALRNVLRLCTTRGFSIVEVDMKRSAPDGGDTGCGHYRGCCDQGEADQARLPHVVSVTLQIRGKEPIPELITALDDIPGVVGVNTGGVDSDTDSAVRQRTRIPSG